MTDRVLEATRWPISPAVLRQIESLGFVPGSGNPVSWMVARLQQDATLLDDYRTEHAAAWAALPGDATGDLAEAIGKVLAAKEAEIAKLRALVPGVEAEWRPASCGEIRMWVSSEGDEIDTAMWVYPAFSGGFAWWVYPPKGRALASGSAAVRSDAIRDCEAAARALGVLS